MDPTIDTSHKDFAISIPKEALAELPSVNFTGKITVIESATAARTALSELEREAVVGFDTETRPNFHKGFMHNVSLIQVSTASTSYLFRINKTGLIPELKAFLECDSVAKVGLSLKDDFLMLHKLMEFTPASFIDLQRYVKEFGITDNSLQKIYGILFGARISKGQRLSNWEAEELSDAQQRYAAIDAWACLRIYRYLSEGNFIAENSPYVISAKNDIDSTPYSQDHES